MTFPFFSNHVVHGVPYFTDTLFVKEITHVDAETVNKLAFEILILHNVPEHLGRLFGNREVGTFVQIPISWVVPLFYNLMIVTARFSCITIIESHRVVNILGYPAPFPALGSWSPENIIVAWIVEIVEVHVHYGNAQVFFPIHNLCVFCKSVAMSVAKGFKFVVIIVCAFFQFVVLNEVNILQTIVVGNDIVVISSLTNVKHSPVFTIDINYRWAPCLPVNICILGH